MRLSLLTTSLLLTSSVWAASLPAQVTWDRNGMPRCLLSAEAPAKQAFHILFRWNNDPYQRDVVAEYKGYAWYNDRTGRSVNGYAVAREFDCFRKESVSLGTKSSDLEGSLTGFPYPNRIVRSQDGEVFGVVLPAEVQDAFEQVRRGASVYRGASEATAALYLAAHPISEFTLELNRELTPKYGVGFVSEIYSQWILSKPKNSQFKDQMMAHARESGVLPSGFLAPRFKERHAIIIKGLGHELSFAKRYSILFENLTEMGVQYTIVQTRSNDPLLTNSALVAQELRRVLDSGKDVILISLCKGAPESLLALSKVTAEREAQKSVGFPVPPTRVEAVLALSGAYGGSFVVDWVQHIPQWWFIKGKLLEEYKKDRVEVPTMQGLLDLAPENMGRVLQQTLVSLPIPRDAIYVNVVGVQGGNGLSQDREYMSGLQNAIRDNLKGYGANDGYFEFPNTQLPDSAGDRVYTIPANATHGLVDGDLDGLKVREKSDNRRILSGLLMAILDQLPE